MKNLIILFIFLIKILLLPALAENLYELSVTLNAETGISGWAEFIGDDKAKCWLNTQKLKRPFQDFSNTPPLWKSGENVLRITTPYLANCYLIRISYKMPELKKMPPGFGFIPKKFREIMFAPKYILLINKKNDFKIKSTQFIRTKKVIIKKIVNL